VLFYHLGFYHGALVLVSVVAFVRVVVILALKFRQAGLSRPLLIFSERRLVIGS